MGLHAITLHLFDGRMWVYFLELGQSTVHNVLILFLCLLHRDMHSICGNTIYTMQMRVNLNQSCFRATLKAVSMALNFQP